MNSHAGKHPELYEMRAKEIVPSLEELVTKITPKNRHPETDWGKSEGKEIW